MKNHNKILEAINRGIQLIKRTLLWFEYPASDKFIK